MAATVSATKAEVTLGDASASKAAWLSV